MSSHPSIFWAWAAVYLACVGVGFWWIFYFGSVVRLRHAINAAVASRWSDALHLLSSRLVHPKIRGSLSCRYVHGCALIASARKEEGAVLVNGVLDEIDRKRPASPPALREPHPNLTLLEDLAQEHARPLRQAGTVITTLSVVVVLCALLRVVAAFAR